MRRDFVTAFIAVIVFTILLGFVYPMLVTGVSQGIFPGNANGSLIKRDGVVVGSALIGQQFYEPVIGKNGKQVLVKGVPQTQPDPRYFQTRPSSTSDNAAGSGFSNLGPNDKTTLVAFQGYIQTYLALNKAPDGQMYDPTVTTAAQIPVDAVDDSASSVDPDIGPRPAADHRRRPGRDVHDRPQPRLPRRARRQRAGAQPRPRSHNREQVTRCRRK